MASFSEQLEAAGASVKEVTALRDKLILRRRQQGASLREIADEAGLSHTAVAKILTRFPPIRLK